MQLKNCPVRLQIGSELPGFVPYIHQMGTVAAETRDSLLKGVADSPGIQSPDAAPPPEAILAELRKIIASGGFAATERSRKLLEFLVDESLAGRGARIKAYCIGTVVFGRPESFDPQKDPIVRIEAARLRRDLEHYYLTDGIADPVVIDIPKGGYVPRFTSRNDDHSGGAMSKAMAASGVFDRGWWKEHLPSVVVAACIAVLALGVFAYAFSHVQRQSTSSGAVQIPGLLVKPLSDLTHSQDSAVLAQGLTERIIEKTSRFKELAVIPGDSDTGQTPTSVARYEFGGTLRDDGGQLLVQTRLVDRMDGRVIWADSFDVALQPRQLFNVETTIADQIATRIAEPSGILFEAERRMWLEAPPDNLDAYLCTLSAYVYRASFAAGKFADMRNCLEQAVAQHPDYATAWALLSLAYVDEYRFFYPAPQNSTTPPLTRAYDAARRAAELDPGNVRAQQALMMTLFFRKEYSRALEVGAKALALNPNDVELKGDYGYRLALSGNWNDGCRLVQQAMDSSARKIAYINTALALCRLYEDDLPAAARLITQADADDNPAYHMVAAAILAEAGDAAGALEHRQWLEKNTPRQIDGLLAGLPERLVRPIDQARFKEALHKAGFAPSSGG